MPQQTDDLYYQVSTASSRGCSTRSDYTVDEKAKTAMLTDDGVDRGREGLGVQQHCADDLSD